MTQQRETREIGRRKLLRLRHVVLALVLAACGGTLGKRTAGGESHFLETCRADCGPGLECISGVCTRGCLVDESDCSDLSPGATCTNQSVEPGTLAVCDLACERDRDCTVLGRDFRCPEGFCRAPSREAPPDNPPDPPENLGGGGGGPSLPPFAPQCETPLDFASACSIEATCAELHCGDGFSQFDQNGCTRYCDSDADCGTGERCRHTALAKAGEDCPSVGEEVEACSLEDGRCSCSMTEGCDWPSICVDATAYPASLDCVVDDATCSELNTLQGDSYDAMQSKPGTDLAAAAARCDARVRTRRDALGCGPNPLIPFLPECAEPVDIPSNCGFEATCAALGCGDGLSQFGEDGCTRYCETSADCGAGQRCRHTRLVLSEEECPSLGSEVESCSMAGDVCECSTTADCPRPDICVDAAKYPASLDCAVESASCQALGNGEFELQLYLETEPATDVANEAQTCLDAIRAQQQALACAE